MRAKGKGLAGLPNSAPPRVDPDRIDQFYRQYYLPLVRRSTWRHGLAKEDARDVVQEAFIVALAKLDPQKNPKAWLIQVVDHLSLNFRRKVLRRAKLTSRWSYDQFRGELDLTSEIPGTHDELGEDSEGTD